MKCLNCVSGSPLQTIRCELIIILVTTHYLLFGRTIAFNVAYLHHHRTFGIFGF